MNDDIEDLGLDVNGHAFAAQLVLDEVEFEIRKSVLHYHLNRRLTHLQRCGSKTTSGGGKTNVS